MNKRRARIRPLAAAVLLMACGALHAQVVARKDTFGDAMRLLLPATAAALTLANHDGEGFRELAYTSVLAAGLTETLKYAVHSRGPDGSARAFPSGHTAMAFSAASFVDLRYGLKTALPMYALAALTAYTRVSSHHHSTRDVLGGALVGTVSAQLMTNRFSPGTAMSIGYSQHTLVATFEENW
jgi:membrane-associated phospholipid phosphatase